MNAKPCTCDRPLPAPDEDGDVRCQRCGRDVAGVADQSVGIPVRLADADLIRLADLVADRVAARLAAAVQPAPPTDGHLVDAATLASLLGVKPAFVYEHQKKLGVRRLGTGPRARLRFDPVAARAVLAGQMPPVAAVDPPRALPKRGTQAPGSILASRPRKAA